MTPARSASGGVAANMLLSGLRRRPAAALGGPSATSAEGAGALIHACPEPAPASPIHPTSIQPQLASPAADGLRAALERHLVVGAPRSRHPRHGPGRRADEGGYESTEIWDISVEPSAEIGEVDSPDAWCASADTWLATPHSADATVNPVAPARNMAHRPTMSPKRPPTTSPTATAREYPPTIHC